MKEMAAAQPAWEIPITEATYAAQSSSGIRALMLAVLENAIQNFGSSAERVHNEAERWIMSRERRYVFSFVVICETLELAPSAVRGTLLALLDQKRTPGRLLRRSRPNVRHRGRIH